MNILLSQFIIKYGGKGWLDFSDILYLLPVGEHLISELAFDILICHPSVRHYEDSFKQNTCEFIELHNLTIIKAGE